VKSVTRRDFPKTTGKTTAGLGVLGGSSILTRPGKVFSEIMMNFRRNRGLVIILCLAESIACADSLQLKNGSLIEGKFMGGTESEIRFQVASSVQTYNLVDIVSVKFDSERTASDITPRSDNAQTFETRRTGTMRRKIDRQATDEDGGRRDENRKACSIFLSITS